MMKMKTANQNTRVLTIEEYLKSGKVRRVVFKTYSKRYLIDIPLTSLFSRLLILSLIPVLKIFSLFLNDLSVAVIKFTSESLA